MYPNIPESALFGIGGHKFRGEQICSHQLVLAFVSQTLWTQKYLYMEALGMLPMSSMTFCLWSSIVPQKYLGHFLYILCLQKDSYAAQLFPIVLLDTNNISSDCCMHFLEEVKQTEEIRIYIPTYNTSNEKYLVKIFSATK